MKAYTVLLVSISLMWGKINAQCSVHIIQPQDSVLCKGDSILLIASGSGTGGNKVLDQSQLMYNGGTSARTLPGYSEWQSFTAGITGSMTELDIGFFNYINGSGQLLIFSGTGTAGTLLQAQTVTVNCPSGNCLLPFAVSVPVVATHVYTFQFIPGAGIPDPYGVQVDVPGSYAGGEMDIVDPSGTYNTGFDMVFKTWVAGSGALTYRWSTGSTDTSTKVYGPGKYSVTASGGGGCTAFDSIHIFQDSLSVQTLPVGTTCGLNNGSVALTASAGKLPYTINWSNNLHSDTISNLTSSTYYVTVSDGRGCAVADSAVVNPSNKITVSVTAPKTQMCASDSLPICATGGFATYQWNTGSTDSCTYANVAGNYYVSVTDSNNCTAVSNPIGISVYPVSSVSIVVQGDTLSSYNAAAYQWYMNGGLINGATSSYYIANQPGAYFVEITDTNGCMAQSNPVTITITGITSLNEKQAVIYPNPSSVASVQLSVGSELIGSKLEVYNAEGRLVFQSEIRNAKSEIVLNVSSGVYLVKLSSSTGVIIKKLMKIN